MKKEVADKWVAALRSGEYQQCQSRLRDADVKEGSGAEQITPGARFCCLGVLCDLYAKEHPHARWITEEASDSVWCLFAPDVTSAHVYEGSDRFVLPRIVCNWSGVHDSDGAPDSYAARDALKQFPAASLTDANDKGASFKQIADFIEQYWQDL